MTRPPLGLVGVAAVVAIVAATGMVVRMQRMSAVDAFTTAIFNLATGMSRQTQGALDKVDLALKDIRGQLEADRDDVHFAASVDRLFDWQKRLSVADALLIADSDGHIVAATRKLPPGAIPSAMVDTLRADDDHPVVVGDPVQDKVSRRWTALMARRLDDPQGRFAGVIAAEISLTELQAFYQLAMPPQRSISVLRRDGTLLVRFPPQPELLGHAIPAQSPWHAFVANGGGTYQGLSYFDPVPVVASALALQNLPLVVEASVTESAILASWRNQTPLIVLAGLCAIGGVLLLLRLIGRAYRRLEASETALLVAHEQLDATLGNLAQGVCFFDQDQRVIVCNKRYATIFDLPDDAITPGMTLSGIIVLRIAACTFVGDSVEAFVREIAASVREGKPGDRIFDLPDGRTILGHIEPLPGRGWVATVEDITERRRAEAKIAFLARHDVLTGLANRGLFQERLTQALAMAERGRGFALLLIDLDRFKPVNDRFGHAVGDLLLCAVADRLRNVVRASATIARLGGDEFAIVELDVADSTEATSVARRVVHSIEQGFDLEGDRITIGCSIGIAMAPADGCHPIQLMKCADLALYRSKEEGRGTWRFFEPAMDTDAAERRTLAADLRNAVLLGQLEVHYQPVVGCGDRAVHGFEALARWRHPTRGMLPPGMFISIAEEVGLIADLGAWVLRQACADAVDWPGHVRVAVNLSTRQFRGRDLIGTVTSALQDAGLSADRLELEITESVPLQEDQMTLATLHDLQALGIRIALDDFGTGYSSLSYVRSFPFDTIKIDRSFVADLPVSDKTIALVRGIIDLAANLGMRITAEGVETESQFQCLAAAGCTEIQGYLISKPLPGCEIPALLDRLAHPVPV